MRVRRAGTPIEVGDLTITPIVEVGLHVAPKTRAVYIWGSVRPVAVLIRRGEREEHIDLRTGTRRAEPKRYVSGR